MTQALLDAPIVDTDGLIVGTDDAPDTDDEISIIDPTHDRDVKTALVVGDMHGNLFSWGRTIVPAIRRHRPDVVIQVGDFGFGWDQYYLEVLDEILDDCAGPDVIWLDGNHENFDWLEAMAAFGAPSAFATSRRTWYLPRGYTWEWQGRRCMSVGGAYSVDKPYRTPRSSWWEQEELTDADVARAQAAGHVDVLFAHDAFAGFKVPGPHAARKQAGEFDRLAQPNRLKLLDIVKSAKPSLYVHGHYHWGYERDARAGDHEVHVVGLNREDEPGSMALLEFPSLTGTGL